MSLPPHWQSHFHICYLLGSAWVGLLWTGNERLGRLPRMPQEWFVEPGYCCPSAPNSALQLPIVCSLSLSQFSAFPASQASAGQHTAAAWRWGESRLPLPVLMPFSGWTTLRESAIESPNSNQFPRGPLPLSHPAGGMSTGVTIVEAIWAAAIKIQDGHTHCPSNFLRVDHSEILRVCYVFMYARMSILFVKT